MDTEKEGKDLRALQSDNDSELQTDTSIDIAVPSTKPQDVEPTVDPTPHHMNYPDGGWRAWSVAYGASGVLFCTFGYANTFGVFQEYYAVHQLSDQTPSAISWIGSLQIFFLFSGNLFGGPLFDRYGAKIIWPPAILYLFSVFMTSICKEFYQFILAQGVLCGICMGMTLSPCLAALSQYFNKKRGAAMGIAIAGSSLGGVIFPIAISKMFANPRLGFGWSIRIAGFIMVCILIPSCLTIRARLPPRAGKFFLLTAFTEPTYLIILAGASLIMLGVFMPVFYLPTLAIQHGMSTQLALYLAAILNATSLFGRVIPGVLSNKIGPFNIFAAAALSTGILIFCMQKLESNASIIVFACVYGFCSGANVSGLSVVLSQTTKDARNIGTYMGMAWGIISIAVLVGPPIDGAFVSHYGGFNEVSDFCGAAVILGGICVLVCKTRFEKGIWGRF